MNAEEKRIHALASEQYGIITRAQARQHMSERQIDNRIGNARWLIVHPGVSRVAGTPVTTRQRLFAATQSLGDCAISHVAAGRLLRLECVPKPTIIDISSGHRSGTLAPGIAVHRTVLPHVDRVTVDHIPCTSATRTLIDLGAALGAEELETAFESARRMRLTSYEALARRASELCRQGKAGSAAVKQLLRVAESRPLESRLEVRVARLLRAHGIPAAANQYAVGRYRIDFAWPARLLGVECEGFEHHGRRLVWKRDRRRIAALEAAGWRLVHVTWDDVTRHPDETVARLRTALQRAA